MSRSGAKRSLLHKFCAVKHASTRTPDLEGFIAFHNALCMTVNTGNGFLFLPSLPPTTTTPSPQSLSLSVCLSVSVSLSVSLSLCLSDCFSLSLSLSLPPFYLFISFQSIFNDFCCSCMFITINSGSILFYLFIYCLSCLNINRVCKTFLFLYNCFTSFHLFDSLARTSC